jgi:hypothetical protein
MDQSDNIQPVPVQSSADHTGHDSGNESGQDMVFVSMQGDGDDGGGLLDPGDIIVNPMSKTGFSVVHHSSSSTADLDVTSSSLYPSQVPSQSVISTDVPMADEGMLGGLGCTLTELNMSQKSTEVDLQSLLHTRNSTRMDLSSDDSDDDYNYCDDEDSMDTDLFGSLAESTPSFSVNGTPSNKMYITPQSTPHGSYAQTPSSSCVSTPVRSNSNPGPQVMQTGFMSEFEKFLQQSSKSKRLIEQRVNQDPVKSHTVANNQNKPVNRQLLPHQVSVANVTPSSRNHKSRAFCQSSGKIAEVNTDTKETTIRTEAENEPKLKLHEKTPLQNSGLKIFQTCAGKISIKSSTELVQDLFAFSEESSVDPHVSALDPSVDSHVSHEEPSVSPRLTLGKAPFDSHATVQESESQHLCHYTKSSPSKVHTFNVKRFIKADKKIMQLRREALKFLKTVFPDMDFPSCKRGLVTVDVLLSQVLDCVMCRRHSGKRLQVIPTQHQILDVRILACKSPQACLRHLRRKICRVLQALLPDLDLSSPFNQGSDSVDALLKEITHCNKVAS